MTVAPTHVVLIYWIAGFLGALLSGFVFFGFRDLYRRLRDQEEKTDEIIPRLVRIETKVDLLLDTKKGA
jgi:hypothetical protein